VFDNLRFWETKGRLRMKSVARMRPKWSLLVPISLGLLAACDRSAGGDADIGVVSSALTSADVLGFEAVNQWRVVQGSVQSLTLTDTRTKGAKALAVARPSGYTRLDSVNLPSSNAELAKIERGASAVVDFMIPTQQASPYWFGAVQMYVSVPSRNLHNAYLGQVELTGMRTAVYSTLAFKIPDEVADALNGQTYSDLVFGIAINVPLNAPGTYRLDNLRIRGKLPPPPDPEAENANFGGQSILLEAWKAYSPAENRVADSTFTPGVIQIPQSFHPSKGRAGAGSATFAYRLGTSALVTCQYPAEAAGTNYVFASCSNGGLAGDLVPASFVRLTVVNGDAAAGKTKVKAQIALNPVGDELYAGLPPIPTFFTTTGEEVTAFMQAQRNWQVSGKVLVKLPAPHTEPYFSVSADSGPIPQRPPEDNDPPFGRSGWLTNDTRFDAGWHARGSIAAPIDPMTGSRRTEFRMDIGTDVWTLNRFTGNVIGITGQIDTNTPAPVGGSIPPTTHSGRFCFHVMSDEAGCEVVDGQTGLNVPLFDDSRNFPIASFPFGIFFVDATAVFTVNANLTGGFTPTGFGLGINPSAALRARLRGGIGVPGFFAGGLSVTADILRISMPITTSVNATISMIPGSCRIHLAETLDARAIFSMGRGVVAAWAEAGLCCGCDIEACWRDEWPIYRWPDIASQTIQLQPEAPLASHDIPLNVATVCPPVDGLDGVVTYPVPQQQFREGDRSFMKAHFMFGVDDDGEPTIVTLGNQVWTSSDPSDQIFTNGLIRYGTPGQRTLTVSASTPGVGSGTTSTVVNVVANDPVTAPRVQVLWVPVPNDTFECQPINGLAEAVDPNAPPGSVLSYEWFLANAGPLDVYLSPGISKATGADVSFSAESEEGQLNIVRVIVTDVEGKQSMLEVPAFILCPT
jgi:hypothetical protein